MSEERVPFNLSVNGELKRLMQVQCASDQTDVSEVTEKLYREYLAGRGVRIRETPATPYSGRKKGKK